MRTSKLRYCIIFHFNLDPFHKYMLCFRCVGSKPHASNRSGIGNLAIHVTSFHPHTKVTISGGKSIQSDNLIILINIIIHLLKQYLYFKILIVKIYFNYRNMFSIMWALAHTVGEVCLTNIEFLLSRAIYII